MKPNNRPTIEMYGESDGDKKGIEIIGNGGNFFSGAFNVELHGVKLENAGIKNEGESVVNMSDINTNALIHNTGKSNVTMKRVNVFFKGKSRKNWWENNWFQIIALSGSIAGLIGLFFIFK